ncbi:hypothetical protein SEA_HONK_74 [Microbacterium phage Honk]|uniref:Uncharacterized protein n=1 Tax=Microbacterium phage Honk TaxID=2836095 RepID=A0A8F3E696_9CAUD|nr:hypothetical protein SEA_HONK_74 [Microbacterium phage Honk]
MTRIATLSPAALLALDPEARIDAAEGRETDLHEAHAEVEACLMAVQRAQREAAIAEEAHRVALAIADPAEDKRHGRRPGDVILSVEEPAREALVLGVNVNASGDVFYLVIPYSSRDAAPGDGALSEWVTGDQFRRP